MFDSTPISWVLNDDKIDYLKLLLDHVANVNVRYRNGDSPLHLACDQINLIKVLLALAEYGADINVINHTGNTPLHLASLNGQINCVELLLDYGADINIKNYDLKTAVEVADDRTKRFINTYLDIPIQEPED